MASKSYRASEHKEWDAAGLDAIQERHEMGYVNQEEDGADCLRGEWYIADDESRTIISGTFSDNHSPGSSHNTYAEVYDDETEYRAALAKWEAKPEYTEEYEAEGSAWSVVVGNIGTVCEHENEDEARRVYKSYVKDSKSGLGRAGNESVTLLHNDEVEEEHIGSADDEEDAPDDDGADHETEEPEEGDYTSSDHCAWYQYGKLVLTVPLEDDHVAALRAHMDRERCWPDAYFISDHGNAIRIDMSGASPALKSRYAFTFDGADWAHSSNEDWPTECVSPDPLALYVGSRYIDGSQVNVFRLADGTYAAQLPNC